jgi:hypothetical protein
MSKIYLRLPYLIYLSIASVLVGVILAPLFRDIPVQGAAVVMLAALLHKSDEGRTTPFPRQTYPTASVRGMPRAV